MTWGPQLPSSFTSNLADAEATLQDRGWQPVSCASAELWRFAHARTSALLLSFFAAAAVVAGMVLTNPVHGATEIPFLVTQVPKRDGDDPAQRTSPLSQIRAERGRIVLVAADGAQRVLTAGFHSAADPAVSFDAKRMLFAARRNAGDLWNIYEMAFDKLDVRQITRDHGNCRQPGYQATLYTIVSSEPWYQLTFVSDAAGTMNEDGSSVAQSLYSCKLDGSEVRRLTYNLSDDADPFLMLDGRLVYACWQRGTLARGQLGRVALFGVNIDGTDYALFGDPSGLPVKRMPCVTDRGLVVFVESEFGGNGSGQLSSVTFRRPLHSYRPITSPEDGYVYRSPSPWPGGRVIVSRRPRAGSASYGICVFNPVTGVTEPLLDEPKYDEVQARALRDGREPDGRSSVVNDEDPYGKLYCLNVNTSDFKDPAWHSSGTALRIRFLEGVPVNAADSDCYLPPSADRSRCIGSTRNGLPPLVQRRVLGETAIRPDGSFNVQLPADTPVQLQTVDENGMALRTCGWIWSKNRESRGCIGCHEDGELTPENSFVDAMQRPSVALTLPVQRRRTVDFRRDVMPIIQQKCVACHGPNGAPPRLDGGLDLVSKSDGTAEGEKAYFNRAYLSLLATRGGDGTGTCEWQYVDPGQARTSPLIWHLFDRNTARPWDGDVASRVAKPLPKSDVPPLSELERRTFIEWVDMGALWDGIPRSSDGESGPERSK